MKTRTGTIAFVAYNTSNDEVEKEFGEVACDCCKHMDGRVAFLPADLPAGLAFNAKLVGLRVEYDLDCVNRLQCFDECGQPYRRPRARNIRLIEATAPAACG